VKSPGDKKNKQGNNDDGKKCTMNGWQLFVHENLVVYNDY